MTKLEAMLHARDEYCMADDSYQDSKRDARAALRRTGVDAAGDAIFDEACEVMGYRWQRLSKATTAFQVAAGKYLYDLLSDVGCLEAYGVILEAKCGRGGTDGESGSAVIR